MGGEGVKGEVEADQDGENPERAEGVMGDVDGLVSLEDGPGGDKGKESGGGA